MKKWIILLISTVLTLTLGACSTKENTEENEIETIDVIEENNNEIEEEHEDKTLILYFSESGNTEVIGNEIHEQIGGDIVKIVPVVEYPHVYEELADYAKAERDNDERPAFQDLGVDPREYDVVFLGYPIWWYRMPMIMETLFDTYDFSGVTIIPFNTHEGSGNGGTYEMIQDREPNAKVLEGLPIRGSDVNDSASKQAVKEWLESLGY